MFDLAKPFTFEDIATLNPAGIKAVIEKGGVTVNDWAFALKGYNEDIQSVIFAKFADYNGALAERIWDEMCFIGLIYTSEHIERQCEIVRKICKLAERGEIAL